MQAIRWHRVWMLAPTLIVIIGLFGGGLLYGLIQSLGYQPRIGATDINLSAYQYILSDPRFWSGLGFTLWVSVASTVISAILAVLLALLIRETGRGQRVASFLFQSNLPIPHLVAAIGFLFLLSQSGLISRMGAAIGLMQYPADFPVVVRDSYGIGIILTYIWKETPFIGLIVLATLQSTQSNYEAAARNLGASRWQTFWHVTLPLILPALLSASVIVFAFVFGAYEVPRILGVRRHQMLSVLALRLFNDADLTVRSQAMALSIIIALVVMALVVIYMLLRHQAEKRS